MNLDPQNNNKLLGGLFQLFFKFKKTKFLTNEISVNNNMNNINSLQTTTKTQKETEAIKANFYLIFPNVNLEIKRISTLKLSNSSKINKFLVKKLEKNNNLYQLNDEILDWGHLGMSLEHRIVALLNNKESRQQIIFGIWINFPKENGVKKNISEQNLENIIQKNRDEIFKACLKFLFTSEKINEIDSASPDENVFLLILFISGIPFNFEVKIYPNEMDKPKDNEFANEWLIAKYSTIIEKNNLFSSNNLQINSFKNSNEIDFNFEKNLDKLQFKTLSNYINEKFKKNKSQNNSGSNIKSNNSNNNSKNIIRNNSIVKKNNINSSNNKRSNEFLPNESNINKISIENSKNFLKTDSSEINFYNNNINQNLNSIEYQQISKNNQNISNKILDNSTEIHRNINNRFIEKTENYKNYRDKLNDLFERDNLRNINNLEISKNNNDKEVDKNMKNINNLKNISNKKFENEIVFSASNKKNLMNSNNENINFNYDYPLKIEKYGRSNSVNKELPKPKPNPINENNSDLKGSQSANNQYKSIPRQHSVSNYHKNPDKELTYVDSFSKEFTESKNTMNNDKNQERKNSINKGNVMNYINYNSNTNSNNFNFKSPSDFPINQLNNFNNLDESETLSIHTNHQSRQDTLKTVSISHKNSFSRDKNNIINSEKKGYIEHNISDNNYIQESIINSNSIHKKYFSMIDGNKTNNPIQNSVQFPINFPSHKNIIKGNNPIAFQSHQLNLQQSSNLKTESEFDKSNPKNSNLFPNNDNNNNYLTNKIFPSNPDFNTQLNLRDPNNNLRNAYTIIYDQANSIQILQEKVNKLQSELENVVCKLKNQSEEKSLTCSCGNRKSYEKQIQLISTGTNTSIDYVQNLNMDNSAINSNKSNNNLTNLIMKNNNKEGDNSASNFNKIKSEEDIRYDNLLNDNSINFPKQFLDMDSKQYDSHREDTHNNQNENNNNNNTNRKEISNYNDNINKTNTKNNFYDNNNFKGFNNFNNNNLNSNLNPTIITNNNVSKKNSSNNSIVNNNYPNNTTHSISDLTQNDNINLVSFNNANSNYGLSNNIGCNRNNNQMNYQPNYYSNEFKLNNNELKKINNNTYYEPIDSINTRNININNEKFNSNSNSNLNNFKKDKSGRNNPNQNNVFSTIQSLGGNDDEEFNNYPFNPYKYQTIDNVSNNYKENIKIRANESENITNNNKNEKINNFYEKNSNPSDIKVLDENVNKNNQFPNYINTSITNNFNNNNYNNNQFANSFITNLEKLNDSSYIASHDLDNKINYEYNNENKQEDKFINNIINNTKQDKSKIEIPKTCSINNNLEITANDNTSINYDISHSIDPGTHRLFLKAPSMLYKTNNSILREDTESGKPNKNKMNVDTSAFNHNDKTINIPKIFFDNNESLESLNDDEI